MAVSKRWRNEKRVRSADHSFYSPNELSDSLQRGVKRATMALALTQLCVCWELLQDEQAYMDMGRDYFERRDEDRVKRQLVKRLVRLGYTVNIEKKARRLRNVFGAGHEETRRSKLNSNLFASYLILRRPKSSGALANIFVEWKLNTRDETGCAAVCYSPGPPGEPQQNE